MGDRFSTRYSKLITPKHFGMKWDSCEIHRSCQVTKKAKKYDEDEDFEDSEDAESDITESDFEDPDEMEVRTISFSRIIISCFSFTNCSWVTNLVVNWGLRSSYTPYCSLGVFVSLYTSKLYLFML